MLVLGFDYVKNVDVVIDFFIDWFKQFFSLEYLCYDIVDVVIDIYVIDLVVIVEVVYVLDVYKDDVDLKD